MNSIDLRKALREADDFSIKPGDGWNLGHNGSSEANVYYSKTPKELIHGVVQFKLMVNGDHDEDISTKSCEIEQSQGQGEPVLPLVNACKPHQNECRHVKS